MPRCTTRHNPTCSFLLVAIALTLGLSGNLLAPPPLFAQDAIQAAIEHQGSIAPEKREELYRQLRSQAEVLQAQAAVVKTVAKLVGPTVVHIEADVSGRYTLGYGRSQMIEEAGSGVIIQWNGKQYVLTNRHVVSGATLERIKISLADGRQIHPQKVWEDPQTDVAVMAVAAPDLAAAPIGDSSKMEIGDFVLAVGSPFGLSHSVTYGIISAKGRRNLELGSSAVVLQDFIQTDAAINPGNSGGPLINLLGEVIGINTAIASNSGGSEGIAFAIPIDMFMSVAAQLIEHGKVSRAFLGVTLDRTYGPQMAAEVGLPRPIGARVTVIAPDSPAQAAGLQSGDIILQIDDVTIEDDAHLVNVVNLAPVGKEVALVLFRDRQSIVVKTTLNQRP